MGQFLSFLNRIFYGIEDTPEILMAKSQLLSNMQEKYNDLIAEGKSPSEAEKIVIEGFGDADEVLAELGISRSGNQAGEQNIDKTTVEKYFAHKKQSGFRIGFGVMLCILSVTFPILFGNSDSVIVMKNGELVGVLLLFISIAAAVSLFVLTGLKSEDYKCFNKPFCVSQETALYAKTLSDGFKNRYAMSIVVSIAAYILSIIPTVVMSELNMNDNLGAVFLFIIVGAATFNLIYHTYINEGFKTVLKKKQNNAGDNKENALHGAVSAIYWCIVTAVYLAWSFITMDWGRTWIIWPVAGVLFGAVEGVIMLATKNSAKQ